MASEIIMPQLGLTMTEGTVSQWLKKDGDSVSKGDELVEVETDKISNIVEAHADGILQIVMREGESGPVQAVIGYICQPGEKAEPVAVLPIESAPTITTDAAMVLPVKAEEPKPQIQQRRIIASPLARKIAKERDIDLSLIRGTGPNGRIVKADIENHTNNYSISPTAAKLAKDLNIDISTIQADGRIMKADVLKAAGIAAPVAAPALAAKTAAPSAAPKNGVLLKGMRKVIAQRLSECWRNTPHVHHTVEINMTKATELRQQFIAMDKKFSFTDLIVKAMCKVLEEYRNANDSLVDGYLIHNEEINMGVAVALDAGLIVPVIKNANHLGLMDIHEAVGELAKKARDNKLSSDEITGGTCTISNLGMYGCDHFTPIVNPPEATILGVCRIVDKPIVVDGKIVIAPMMNVILGYDHRVVDGAVAGQVTSRLREYLENPLLLL